VAELNIPPAPAIPGAKHLHSGKVRDLYELEEGPYAGQLLMVASDRISAFDHVFDTVIPDKGEILTKLSLWWFEQFEDLVPTHVLSTDVPESVAGRAVVAQ
jgi:phosphoribosylaminoimidazole-succinocarboxamide synthase